MIKDVDKRVYQYLQTRCQLLLKSYPTTLEEDSAELHEAGKVPFIYYVSTCITQNLTCVLSGRWIGEILDANDQYFFLDFLIKVNGCFGFLEKKMTKKLVYL